jgi:hypothetical protein
MRAALRRVKQLLDAVERARLGRVAAAAAPRAGASA